MDQTPIAHDLSLALSATVQQWPGDYLVTNGVGGQCGPWFIERALRDIKPTIADLNPNFSFHDLRHYFASTLIDAGAPITAVQRAMRHENATTILRVYSHLMPNAEDATRSAIANVMTKRAAPKATAY